MDDLSLLYPGWTGGKVVVEYLSCIFNFLFAYTIHVGYHAFACPHLIDSILPTPVSLLAETRTSWGLEHARSNCFKRPAWSEKPEKDKLDETLFSRRDRNRFMCVTLSNDTMMLCLLPVFRIKGVGNGSECFKRDAWSSEDFNEQTYKTSKSIYLI